MADQEALSKAHQEGLSEGYDTGFEEGYEAGYEAALKGADDSGYEGQEGVEMALEECKAAFTRISKAAEGDNAYLWALSELMKHIASETWELDEKPW